MKEIYNLNAQQREEELQKILTKYMASQSENTRKTKWKNEEFVRNVIKKHIKYLTIERNKGIEDEKAIINEGDAYRYLNLYNTKSRPNIEKLTTVLNFLDEANHIGKENANKILKGFGKIVQSDLEKLALKIRIVNAFDYMERMIENPSKFTISPEYLYARLAYYQDKNGNISNIPASKVLSDKDEYSEFDKKKINPKRKEQLISLYSLSTFENISKVTSSTTSKTNTREPDETRKINEEEIKGIGEEK